MDLTLVTSLLSALPHPALVIGRDDRILAANDPAQTILGKGAVGRLYVLSLRHPALAAAVEAALAEGTRATVRLPTAQTLQDTVHQVSVAPVADGQAVLCLFQDVSAQERVEQMRRDFVANVSHELRTPLTALLGFIETLKGAARDDPAARDRFLSIMEREAGRMNRLVRDLLHLSRVEAEERVRPGARVDLAALLTSTATALRPMAEAAGVALDLQGADQALPAPGDGDQLIQVFQNLIENAVKYGGPGRPVTLRLSREQGPRGALARIDVIDRGEGIDAIHLPRLTERFYRIDTHRSREQGGTGLGLAIVKHIVNRHRGTFRIESARGKGSTFSVLLPLS